MGLGGTTRSAQAFSTFSASFFGVFGIEMVSSYLFTSIVSPSRRALGFCVRLRSMRAPLAPRRHCSATALFRTISACSYAPLFSSVSLFGGIHRCFATNRGCGGDHCTSRSARGPARPRPGFTALPAGKIRSPARGRCRYPRPPSPSPCASTRASSITAIRQPAPSRRAAAAMTPLARPCA